MKIDGVEIGNHCSPYIVAEVSGNHNGSIDRAKKIMSSAKKCGANAVKLQTYTADTITINSQSEDFKVKGGLWDGYTLYDLYKWAETPFEWHKDLFDHARSINLTCFSTPFDETAIDLLESLNAPAYKIASFEVIDLPLIKYAASTKKPLIISTGMANLAEISEAVEVARDAGCNDLMLLHCISSYPAPIDQSNLTTIADLKSKFKTLTGLSDHTLGTNTSIAAVALGASFIEKHFTLNRSDGGPDSAFSIEPDELKKLCVDAHNTWLSLGKPGYDLKESEAGNIKFRRSLYFINNLNKGHTITVDDIKSIRPGFGIAPKYYSEIIGKTLSKDINFGDSVQFNCFEK
ncbi:MAG: pseudaminic acid synthase [Bermanella sp.]